MQITQTIAEGLRRYSTQLIAMVLVAATFVAARQPAVPRNKCEALASSFQFTRSQLDMDRFAKGELLSARHVHPSLERISAWISGTGAAATLADLDGDGLANDLCLVDPRVNCLVILPVPETGDRYAPFELDCVPLVYDREKMSPTGSVAGDFNEDGFIDLLVYYWGRTPVLYFNRCRTGTAQAQLCANHFLPRELVAGEPGLEPARWYTHAAMQLDADGDGHLDLLIGNFFQDGADILNVDGTGIATVMQAGKSKAMNGGGAKLFLWESGCGCEHPAVRYRDASQVFDNLFGRGWVLAAGAADLDSDGLPEIYLAQDFGPDRLLYNRSQRGQPSFILCEGIRDWKTPKSFVLGHDSFKGMGVDFGDVNGDGHFDIYVSNIADQWALQESHFLWLNTGHPELLSQGIAPFVQASEPLGLSRSGWGWDCKFADFNNDGALEAIQATGFVKGKINRWPELQALGTSNEQIIHDPRCWPRFQTGADLSGDNLDAFFVRSDSGRFENIGNLIGLDESLNTRGIAIDDVDGDGRLDFVTANQWEPSYLFRNTSSAASSFLGLHLLLPLEVSQNTELTQRAGHPGPDMIGTPAVGAVATVRLPDGRKLIEQADGGSAHSGRGSPAIHFGLGRVAPDHELAVDLRWTDLAGNRHEASLNVQPGWHTIVLGQTQPGRIP